MSASIQISGLSKTFGDITAVNNVNFDAYQGEVIALLGPNGAGKSTLMNMISGYLAPDCGKITLLGIDLAQSPLQCKNLLGFLPEGSPLYPDLTVRQFLVYMAELRGFSGKELTSRLEAVAVEAKITAIMNQRIDTLSKGYARRVGFAQSLLSNPPILLLDEPTDGLDPNQKEHIRRLIDQMRPQKTILISTHLLDEAAEIANRIIIMNKGQIRADGALENILHQYGCDTLEQLFKQLTR